MKLHGASNAKIAKAAKVAKTAKPPKKAVRNTILAAASARFSKYGYTKTTMAEIARDCDMSAANLYRYFANKLDIGATLARTYLDEKLARLNHIVQQSERPTGERLAEAITQALEFTHRQWSSNPRMNEMVTAICAARTDIVDHYAQEEHQLLVQLLADGIIREEFSIADIDEAATAIASAMTAFNHPLLMPQQPLDTLRRHAAGVSRLLLKGLLLR
jgi:AcrR family transcriptional regulator